MGSTVAIYRVRGFQSGKLADFRKVDRDKLGRVHFDDFNRWKRIHLPGAVGGSVEDYGILRMHGPFQSRPYEPEREYFVLGVIVNGRDKSSQHLFAVVMPTLQGVGLHPPAPPSALPITGIRFEETCSQVSSVNFYTLSVALQYEPAEGTAVSPQILFGQGAVLTGVLALSDHPRSEAYLSELIGIAPPTRQLVESELRDIALALRDPHMPILEG